MHLYLLYSILQEKTHFYDLKMYMYIKCNTRDYL